MISIVGAFKQKMDACVVSRKNDRKDKMSRQETTETNKEKTEPDPGMR
jgi:hypothetical protein